MSIASVPFPSTTRGIRPLHDGIVIEPFALEQKTASGIALPDTALHRNNEAVVVAVGPGRWENGARVPMGVREGDRILFLRWSGYAVTYEGRKLVCIRETDILAVVDEDADVQFEGKTIEQ